MSTRRPPLGFVHDIQRLANDPTLTVEWNGTAARKGGGPVWDVYANDRGDKKLLVKWTHALDGCTQAIADRVAARQYGSQRVKDYISELESKEAAAEESRRRTTRNNISGWASDSRRAFQKLADGTG